MGGFFAGRRRQPSQADSCHRSRSAGKNLPSVMRAFATVLLAALLGPSPSALAQVAELISRNSGGVPADSHSFRPTLSSDGRYVAFESWASNLAAGVDVGNRGVFVRDLLTGTTVLASTSDAGNVPDGKS